MKRLFDENNDTWTSAASKLDREACNVLKPIFEKWIADGYAPREIAHVVQGAATELELQAVMEKQREAAIARHKSQLEEAEKGLTDNEKTLAREGRGKPGYVDAVKSYRNRTGKTLTESKEIVDAYIDTDPS